MRTKGIKIPDDTAMKSMLTRMAMKLDGVAEPVVTDEAEIDCDNEHRCAEHEHEHEHEHKAQAEELPEPSNVTQRRW